MRLPLITLLLALPAAAQDPALDPLLARAARSAEAFAADFPSVACTERVSQLRFAPGGKIQARLDALYDYLILLDSSAGELSVDESRLDRAKPRKAPEQSLLATTGFAVMLLVFHPSFQTSYRFSRLEPESIDGVLRDRVAFEHIPGHASPSVLLAGGREYPLAWKGVAWLDPESGRVARIHTQLARPLDDIGLLSLTSQVDYAPAAGHNSWLPRTASIEARTAHQHWRNAHTFSDYRRFEVTSEQKLTGVPAQPGAPIQ